MIRATLLLALAPSAAAHVMSMSSGDLTLNGARGHYELRMPLYEIAHVRNPERTLLDHVQFSGAQMVSSTCHSDTVHDAYLCSADYDFGTPVDRIEVECTLASVTVPNHVHLLRAEMGGKRDEAVFELGFTRATLRFRPPTAFETAITQSGAGALGALGGAVQILFLAALVIAARSRRELLAITITFLFGQMVSVFIMPHLTWQPPSRFVEAAMALAIAYLAVEILLLPAAGSRWLVTLVLGVFHGMYFHLFLLSTGYSPALVMAGAAIVQIVVVALFAFLFSRVLKVAKRLRPVQLSASALLLFGMAWFFVRLRG